MHDFIGVKIALINGDKLLVIQRDDIPDIPFPGLWDFAGGGRDGSETAFGCAAREVSEELGIHLTKSSVIWEKSYPALQDNNLKAIFMVANISNEQIDGIVFGDEGQGWRLMNIGEFMNSSEVVEPLKIRIKDYLESNN